MNEETDEIPVSIFLVLRLGHGPQITINLFVLVGISLVVTIVMVRLLSICSVQAEKAQLLLASVPCLYFMNDEEGKEKIGSSVVTPEKSEVVIAEIGFLTLLTVIDTVSKSNDEFVITKILPTALLFRGLEPMAAVVAVERVTDEGKVRLRSVLLTELSKVICHR